jgi:hypothetical protein
MHRIWPLAIAIGVSVRLVIWWATIGSNDVTGWSEHAASVGEFGLAEAYRASQVFNHPPLIGLFSSWMWDLADQDMQIFARLIKLPGLAGELLAMLALHRIGGIRLAALYALLPAPILVAAYHGNTDCLYAAFALIAALVWDRKCYMLAGFALAAALNVKLIPLVLVPLFVIASPNRKALIRFSLALGLGMLPYLLPALQAGEAMYRNMITYNSNPDEWGFLALLNDAEKRPETQALVMPLRVFVLEAGRYVIMGSSIALALCSRRRLRLSMREQVALVAALFLFFAPGFGVQYVAFVVPLLLAVSVYAGVFWGVTSGAFIGTLYVFFLRADGKWLSEFYSPFPGWAPELGIVAWAGLGAWIYLHLTSAWRKSSKPADATADDCSVEPAQPEAS